MGDIVRWPSGGVTAFYDLARCPPTFDVVAFLALAERERLLRGADYIDLHVLPGQVSGFRRDSLWPRTIEGRLAMRENVLLPLCRLLPSVRNLMLHESYGEACKAVGWGKGEYLIGLPKILEALRAGSRPLRADEAFGHRGLPQPYITFTLREAEHHPIRNSRVVEWVEAARVLRGRGHRVYFIRDAAQAYGALDGEPTLPEAAVSIPHRAAYYAGAALNVGICNGPMWMSIFMDAPTLMLRPTTNEAHGCYDDYFYAKCGLPRGSQLPTSPPHQRLVWEEDRADAIVAAVEEALQC